MKPVPWLLSELLQAYRTARTPDLFRALSACGLRMSRGIVWGVDFVAIDRHHYAPEPGGKPALIIPHFVNGRLIDLVAVGLRERSARTRLGICVALGEEALDNARDWKATVRLHRDPIEWLRNDRVGAAMVDWRAARHALLDIPSIACDASTSMRIERVMRVPPHMPLLAIDHEQRRLKAA